MNTQVRVFDNPEFGEIRTVEVNSQPYFVGRDVAIALGYARPANAITQHVDNEDTLKQGIPDNQGLEQQTLIINEGGVYSLIFGSKLPQAKGFKKWVTSEVLPSIRKTGGYITAQESDTPEVIMARALIVAQEALTRHAQMLDAMKQQNNILEGQRELLSNQNAILAPKAEYADTVLQSTSTFTTTQLAQGLGMTANKLNKKLQELGVQYKQSGQWMLKGKYKDRGYAKVRVFPYFNETTQKTVTVQSLVWTEKGRLFLHEKREKGQL